MRRRPCCRARRTAGAPSFTETALIPAVRLSWGVGDLYGPLSGEQLERLLGAELAAELAAVGDTLYAPVPDERPERLLDGDTPTAGVSADQLDALPAGVLERALERMAPPAGVEAETANRAPVPRRPWRRVLCWALGGHSWFPDVAACLDCGKERRRAPWRGDR